MEDREAIRQEVAAARKRWHLSASAIEELGRYVQSHTTLAGLIWSTAIDRRRRWRRYLRARFQVRVVYTFNSIRHVLLRPELLLETEYDMDCLTWAWKVHAFWHGMYESVVYSVKSALVAGTDPNSAAWDAYLKYLDTVPVEMAGDSVITSASEKHRLHSTYALAGWAAANISLRTREGGLNRIGKALSREGDSPYNALLEELPSTVIAAQHRRKPDQPLTGRNSLISLITKLLAENSDNMTQPTSADMLEDFAARETARAELREDLTALIERAGLTPLQRHVFELDLDGYKDKEIATELGIGVGDVKTHLHRARKKLRGIATDAA